MERKLRLLTFKLCLFMMVITIFLLFFVHPDTAQFVVLVLSLMIQCLLTAVILYMERRYRRREHRQANR